ncbi:cytochrome c oxidase assembly protein CtaG/Cox11, domain-containing protein [Lentinula guzmanii]|uniref:Cytochrome c oxidase assembly protein CtaG/Cox11, domain-containing protein n=3 Tax=Lentinula TaxID=5352 RepID=A0AA38J4F6_9AGAR|nr:cytochrome c oxidase assembly protein CtaG/Cox11, domain-containing protein [Lentinula guzmanii]KAJ3797025.1 cytochrome c oxidase assembly protein CtaG/Cox11, domain-containing protein [Lentinula aff. detonsa]
MTSKSNLDQTSSSPQPLIQRPIRVGPMPRYRSREEMYAVRAQKNRSLLMYTGAVIITFLGLTYAAVPLYRLFCSATGFAGTPSTRTQAASGPEFPEWMPEWLKTLLSPSTTAEDRFAPSRLIAVDPADNPKSRRFKVTFSSSTSTALPWTFRPAQHHVYVLPGESSLAFYTAKNNSKDDIIGVATYNVTPDRIAPYFSKIECFCFDEQKLLGSEIVDMPLLFFIDKDVLDDPSCRNVEDVVLSYTFFKARRNQQGQLEPDAPEDVIQKSLGFESYELAKKASDESSKGAPRD